MGNIGSNPYQPNHGNLAVAVVVNAITGVDVSLPVPAGTRARPIAVVANLVTDATAVNRFLHLTFDRIITPLNRIIVTTPQTASLTIDHFFSDQNIDSGAITILSLSNPMSSVWLMNPNDTIDTIVENLQAGDRVASLLLYHESWIIAG